MTLSNFKKHIQHLCNKNVIPTYMYSKSVCNNKKNRIKGRSNPHLQDVTVFLGVLNCILNF